MIIAMATANFYDILFENALRIIKNAGFKFIELDSYWQGGDGWRTAQHLQGIAPREAVRRVRDSGLRIAALHDMGGVIEDGRPSAVSSSTYRYLEAAEIPCVIFHAPHRKTPDVSWWDAYKPLLVRDLGPIARDRIVCVENLIPFDGYQVPLLDPGAMLDFLLEADLYATLDTAHYAQCGADISRAAKILAPRIKTLHLADHREGRYRAFLGEGDLHLGAFFACLPLNNIYLATVECAIPHDGEANAVMASRAAFDIVCNFAYPHSE